PELQVMCQRDHRPPCSIWMVPEEATTTILPPLTMTGCMVPGNASYCHRMSPDGTSIPISAPFSGATIRTPSTTTGVAETDDDSGTSQRIAPESGPSATMPRPLETRIASSPIDTDPVALDPTADVQTTDPSSGSRAVTCPFDPATYTAWPP